MIWISSILLAKNTIVRKLKMELNHMKTMMYRLAIYNFVAARIRNQNYLLKISPQKAT